MLQDSGSDVLLYNGSSWLGFCFFPKACHPEPPVLSETGGAATQPFGQHCQCAEKRGPRSGGQDPASHRLGSKCVSVSP